LSRASKPLQKTLSLDYPPAPRRHGTQGAVAVATAVVATPEPRQTGAPLAERTQSLVDKGDPK